MNIDISKIVQEKLAAMESDGSVKKLIEDNVENAVHEAIKSALGGYQIKRELEKALTEQLPEIVKDIGLDGYNAFIGETVKKLAIAGIQEDARTIINARVNEILLKKRESITLSEILKTWRSDMNDNDDEEEKRERNEDYGGFTCRVDARKSDYFTYYTLFFDEEGDKEGNDPDDYQVIVKIDCWNHDNSKGKIKDVYIDGNRISKQFIVRSPSSFEALMLNLYLERTPVIVDMENYDEDDHYYEMREDY